jgi:hypothetical protein
MVNVLDIKYVVISVMGPHAGESENEIFNRKIQDIHNIGLTFWLMKSHRAKPELVQELCLKANAENTGSYCVFIEASSKRGAVPTKSVSSAESYSKDNLTWVALPQGLSPVTGKIDKNAYALVFNRLELVNESIDLWSYADFFNQNNPLKIIQGASTICAIKKDVANDIEKIKSRYRRVVAIGKLCEPFCVYLR